MVARQNLDAISADLTFTYLDTNTNRCYKLCIFLPRGARARASARARSLNALHRQRDICRVRGNPQSA
eukprot:7852449-Heterocapsa_arctica.AAC.1